MQQLFKAGLWLCLFLGGAVAQGQTPTHQVKTDQVRATLLAHAPRGVQSGQTLWLGLRLQHAPDWHTYWKNPGDSGLPTALTWQLPPGLNVSSVVWPTPQKFPLGDLANYGYGGDVLLPVEVRIPATHQAGDTRVQLHAQWLVCRTECIPEEGRFELTLGANSQPAEHQALFEKAWSMAPTPPPQGARAELTPEQDHLAVTVEGLPAAWRDRRLEIFPEEANLIAPGAPWTQTWAKGRWSAQLPYNEQRAGSPSAVGLVLALATNDQKNPDGPGFQMVAQVTGNWPATQARVAVPDALAQALTTAPPATNATNTWLLALGGALLGGLILNLMPCVLPVLAIKVVGFAQHGGSARTNRVHGLAYTAGVLLSFLVLGGGLLALRSAGEQLGWGFQLQSPTVVAALATLFTLIGLNLAGLYGIGQVLPQAVVNLRAQRPAADAFLTGVLATAVASPCTAPFMGASMGLAMGLPTAQALGVFAALGLGMALPYLAASWIPAVARALPQPGPWMDTLKQWLAFPMLATVVWLVWVLGQQTSVDGAALLLLWLLCLGWLLWALGLKGRLRLVMAGTASFCLAWAAVAWGPQVTQPIGSYNPITAEAQTGEPLPAGNWLAWSPERQAAALAQGQVVFVDYTAAWCVTCQYNKRTTLADPVLLQELAARQVVLMRADWTRRDPRITSALEALGRNGVPVYAFYKPGSPPSVLPEIPSLQDMRSALNHL